jgi:hypothetical protein
MNDRRKKGRETGNGVEQAMSALNLEMHKWSADVDHLLPSRIHLLCTHFILWNFLLWRDDRKKKIERKMQ